MSSALQGFGEPTGDSTLEGLSFFWRIDGRLFGPDTIPYVALHFAFV